MAVAKRTKGEAVTGALAAPQAGLPGLKVERLDGAQVVEHVSKAAASVEVSRNAKGQASWTIKTYAEPDGLGAAMDEVLRIDSELARRVGQQQEGSHGGDGG